MEENLPIDIHYNKLQDWLISRRHCQSNWQDGVLKIRQQINSAIQDMPAVDSITQLLQGTYINYFHCKEIIEILKETEGSSKTLFGSYSSKRLQDWINIVKQYDKDNLYLVESGQLLTRCVNYEIPALKKQISKCLQAQQEYERKESEYRKNSIEMRNKYNQSCKNLGIPGQKLKKELCELLSILPNFYENVVKDLSKLKKEINFYGNFVNFISSGSINPEDRSKMLKYIIEKGNTTVYEWKHNVAPEQIIKPELDLGLKDEDDENNEKSDEIDWGAIDMEVISNDNQTEFETIDWGIEDVVIVTEETGSGDDVTRSHDVTTQDQVARGNEALTLMECLKTREMFLNDLYELEAFFKQRLQELRLENSSGSSLLSGLIFQSASPDLQIGEEEIQTMLTDVQSVIDKFQQPKIKELFLISSFPKYVDRLVGNLKKMMADSEKFEAQSKLMLVRQQEKKDERLSLEPKLEIMRMKTKILKQQIEKEISLKYKNRKVNIMGEINAI